MNSSEPLRKKRSLFWPVVIGLFVVLVFGGVAVLMLRDLPPAAQPQALEARFAEQIAHLEDLISRCRLEESPDLSGEEMAPYAELDQGIQRSMIWSEQLRALEPDYPIFADPAILEASIVFEPLV